MSKSTVNPPAKKAPDRPAKPYKDFPLYAHPLGYWSKKILGKLHNFGRWGRVVNGVVTPLEGDTWQEALKLYQAQRDDLYARRTPRAKGDAKGLTVKLLGDTFLTAKDRKLKAGELGARQFAELRGTCQLLADFFGKDRMVDDLAADDFEKLRAELAKRWGPVRLGNTITKIKSVFKYGVDNGLIEKAVRYGSEFRKPDKAVMRRHRAQNGERMLEADVLRKLLDAADVQTRAMTLLGLNCGFGNHDVATLPLAAVDLEKGWIDFPRPKTGIARRCPLWPETVEALRLAIAQRPQPRQEAARDLVFLTARGRACFNGLLANPVGSKFSDLLKDLGAHRKGLGFYTLRHVFRTIADAARDRGASDAIMGHADGSMAGHYIERLDDSRLQAVAEFVRAWLFGKPPADDSPTVQRDNETTVADEPQPHSLPASTDRPQLKLYRAG